MKTQNEINISAYRAVLYFILTAVIIFAVAWEVSAQQTRTDDDLNLNYSASSAYQYAVGVRAGGTSGITGKVFIGNSTALEGILSAGYHDLGFTALFEKYVSAFGVLGLNWYYGGGGHAKFQSRDFNWIERNNPVDDDRLALGVDGIVGLEYKIPPIPIAVSLDVKPNMEVWTTGGVGFGVDPGLGVKVAF